jgi:hypothetical protein
MADEIRAFGWDDTVQTADDSGGDFAVLRPGFATFRISELKRGYFEGSAKMPQCHQMQLTLTCTEADGTSSTVYENLPLLSNWLWKLTAFFKAVRLIPEETPAGSNVNLPWNSLAVGQMGYCKVKNRQYTNKKGEQKTTNQIERFLHGDACAEAQAVLAPVMAAPAGYQQPQQQLSQPWA